LTALIVPDQVATAYASPGVRSRPPPRWAERGGGQQRTCLGWP